MVRGPTVLGPTVLGPTVLRQSLNSSGQLLEPMARIGQKFVVAVMLDIFTDEFDFVVAFVAARFERMDHRTDGQPTIAEHATVLLTHRCASSITQLHQSNQGHDGGEPIDDVFVLTEMITIKDDPQVRSRDLGNHIERIWNGREECKVLRSRCASVPQPAEY